MLILSQYLIKMLKFQVFEVLVETWTLRRKTEQIGQKRTRNGILRIAEFKLVSCRNDIRRPLFQYAKPCRKVDQKARKGTVGESPV